MEMVIVPSGTHGKNPDLNISQELDHLRYARNDLKQLMERDAAQDWNDKVNYYESKWAKEKINADTAIYYSAQLKPEHYYRGKYRNLWVFIRKKENRVVVRSYSLYEDDIPQEELAQYKEAVKNAFKYDDNGRPLIDPEELIAMDLVYEKPEFFHPSYDKECFIDNPRLNGLFTCLGNQLHSKDKSFIVFFPTSARIIDQEFTDRMNRMFPGQKRDLVDKQHVYQLKNDIRYVYGEEAAKDWKNYVSYASREQSKREFNADTVITNNIKLKPEEFYKGTHGNVWTLTLQKKSKGYITLHCLYKDMPEGELAQYIAAVKKIFRYGD